MAMASRRSLHLLTSSSRGISSTPHLASPGWLDKIKTTLADKIRSTVRGYDDSVSSFTLRWYADGIDRAVKAGVDNNSPHAAAKKHAVVLRYLSTIDPTGEKLKSGDKLSAMEQCKCTIADVEHALAKYTYAKEAHKMCSELRDQGRPWPTTRSEIQKIMGKTPLDVLRSNLAKSDLIKRSAVCPCGSKKQYKRCCGASKR